MNTPHDEQPDYPTYYGQPVVRSGHWHWQIVAYFWVGGIAGAGYVIGAVADWQGGEEEKVIARYARYTALVGMIISPILLIWDLAKPSRFLNMLRIFKPRSPMSVGTWGVTALGAFVGGSAVLQAAADMNIRRANTLLRLWNRLAEPFGTLMGMFMAGYTGVLLSTTAVPLWARAYKTNAAVVLSSAFANAAAMLSLLLTLTRRDTPRSQQQLAQLQTGAMLTESALLAYELRALGPTLRRPWTRGKTAPFFFASILCGLIIPLLMGNPPRRPALLFKAIITLLGGLLFRHALVEGGHESARDPQAYHHFNADNE